MDANQEDTTTPDEEHVGRLAGRYASEGYWRTLMWIGGVWNLGIGKMRASERTGGGLAEATIRSLVTIAEGEVKLLTSPTCMISATARITD